MRYQMKQKLFSWADQFVIHDDMGSEVAIVDGKAFSWSNQLSFKGRDGGELASIQQKLLSWGPTYEIYRNGELAAVVKKKQWSFAPTFIIDVPGPDDLTAKGNWSDLEYTFTRGDVEVATVSKQWFAMSDSYGVDIADGRWRGRDPHPRGHGRDRHGPPGRALRSDICEAACGTRSNDPDHEAHGRAGYQHDGGEADAKHR